ncbi:hypothetical protein AK830_g15 [Neonectria ditissima]|uniref:JmjC domain-containing protein n=1 Tax=Neonectria ditissima TaxID=78410 RepID=A0A0P7BHH9_9HYPO|nr:hypothetical protein AK830_g15 [Neonectria ditissima]
MSEPIPPRRKIDLLLSMANDLSTRYSVLEAFVAAKMDVISTIPAKPARRRVRSEEPTRGHHAEDDEHDDEDQRDDESRNSDEALVLVKSLVDLLTQIGKDTRALQSSANAIAAEIHNTSNNSADKKGNDPGGHEQDFMSDDVTMTDSSSEATMGQLSQVDTVAGATHSSTTSQHSDPNPDDGSESASSSETPTQQDASVSVSSTTISTSPANTTLSAADMGDRLVPALEKLAERNKTVKTFSVPRVNITLSQLQASINTDDEAWQYTSIAYKPGCKEDGYARVCISERRSEFDWSVFNRKVNRPSVEEAKAVFEIHCEDLTAVGTIGLALMYYGFWSYNEVYFGPGYKLWLLIAMHYTAKFYDLADCLLIAPSKLEQEGIDFRIEIVGRGEAIATEPGELHAIINYGAYAARSMNYLLAGDRLVADNLTYCSECGLASVYEKYGATLVGPPKPWSSRQMPTVSKNPRKRKAIEETPVDNPKMTSETMPKTASKTTTSMTAMTTRTSIALTRQLNKLEEQIRELDPRCKIPHISRHNATRIQLDVLTMAASIRSSTAIEKFINLVYEWRRRNVYVVISEDTGDVLQQYATRLKAVSGKSILSKFELRYAQSCIAREVDDRAREHGQLRRSKSSDEALAHRLEMDGPELKGHLEYGRRWNAVCGSFDGLLPFILICSTNPLHARKKAWKGLRDERLKALHGLLKDTYTEDHARTLKLHSQPESFLQPATDRILSLDHSLRAQLTSIPEFSILATCIIIDENTSLCGIEGFALLKLNSQVPGPESMLQKGSNVSVFGWRRVALGLIASGLAMTSILCLDVLSRAS